MKLGELLQLHILRASSSLINFLLEMNCDTVSKAAGNRAWLERERWEKRDQVISISDLSLGLYWSVFFYFIPDT